MPPLVARDGARNVEQTESCLAEPPAEVDVLEPDRPEPLVQAADGLQGFTAKHQERSGRLFDLAPAGWVQVEQTVPAIDRVRFPDPVDS